MADWQPYREPVRTTLTRTLSIAGAVGAVASLWLGGLRSWPEASLLALWPALGGHWVDLFFLNGLRPHLPANRTIQTLARVAVWFGGGVVLGEGVRVTGRLLDNPLRLGWLTLATAGTLFVAIELVAHAVLQMRGRPSFYGGMG